MDSTSQHFDPSLVLKEIQERGFAFLPVQKERYIALIKQQLDLPKTTFRFPPLEGSIEYTPLKRAIFGFLFEKARMILDHILQQFPSCHDVLLLQKQLQVSKHEEIFVQPHEPFSENQAFDGSFFNLFHYDYGCLNVHKDRYLITLIAARKGDDEVPHSALWVRSPQEQWYNVDAILPKDSLVVLIGEELSSLAKRCGIALPASDHCIRVDPRGEYIPHSHHRRDPETPEEDNRQSIAFVLGAGDG